MRSYTKSVTYKTKGIIIKRINIGEADRIITFYTATMGKVRAKAVSVRKIESKLAGHLELFMLSDLIFARGRNLDTVTSAQTINSFSNIRKNLNKTSFAYFICELLEKLVPEELKDTRIFNLLTSTFEILNQPKLKQENYPMLLLSFEIKLLDLLGFAPQMSRCLYCARGLDFAKDKSLSFYFSAQLGGILCENCKSYDRLALAINLEEIKLVNLLRSPKVYNLENLEINPELTLSLSQKIDHFMHFIFEKNIRSAEFIKQVKKLGI